MDPKHRIFLVAVRRALLALLKALDELLDDGVTK